MLALLAGGEKFNAVWSCSAQSCSCSNVTLFVQSGRIRAITQEEAERIKICMCRAVLLRAVWTVLYCCSCPLRELELLHKATVYLCISYNSLIYSDSSLK